jgi:hypothetical protein
MTTTRRYSSADAGAPVLTGQVGSLVGVLDACLVNGYGAFPAAGWAIAFTGANKRIYRSAQGSRMFYRVQDDGTNTGFASQGEREARLKGSEAASAIDTQTNLFPTVAQLANGLFVRKASTRDATAIPWRCFADERTVYFYNDVPDYVGYGGFMFGEYYSNKTGDTFNGMVIGRNTEQVAATPSALSSNEALNVLSASNVATAGHYVPRPWSEQPPSAVNVGKHGAGEHSAVGLVGLFHFPNQPNGSLELEEVKIIEVGGLAMKRGKLRGFWHCLHPAGARIPDFYTFSGSGVLAGKNFEVVSPVADGLGRFIMETTVWDVSP